MIDGYYPPNLHHPSTHSAAQYCVYSRAQDNAAWGPVALPLVRPSLRTFCLVNSFNPKPSDLQATGNIRASLRGRTPGPLSSRKQHPPRPSQARIRSIMERQPCRSGHRKMAGQTEECECKSDGTAFVTVLAASSIRYQNLQSDNGPPSRVRLYIECSRKAALKQPWRHLAWRMPIRTQTYAPSTSLPDHQPTGGGRNKGFRRLKSDKAERYTDISKDQLRDLQVREIMSSVPFESPSTRQRQGEGTEVVAGRAGFNSCLASYARPSLVRSLLHHGPERGRVSIISSTNACSSAQ